MACGHRTRAAPARRPYGEAHARGRAVRDQAPQAHPGALGKETRTMPAKGRTLDEIDLFSKRNRVIRVEDGQVIYHCLLMTTIRRMRYDFEQRLGVVYLPEGCCTDMTRAIQFFKKIDPEVQ